MASILQFAPPRVVARVSVCRKKLASANAKASRDSADKADCRASHSLRVQKLIQGSPRLQAGRLFFCSAAAIIGPASPGRAHATGALGWPTNALSEVSASLLP